MCQAVSNEIWIDAQNEYVLDTDYYHIVMTCPQKLYPLMYCNQKEMYSLFCLVQEIKIHSNIKVNKVYILFFISISCKIRF